MPQSGCRKNVRLIVSCALLGAAVLVLACDRSEFLELRARAIGGKAVLVALGTVVTERRMVCADTRGREIQDVSLLSAPVVVLCRDWDRNVDLQVDVTQDSVVMRISALSGPNIGPPPGEALARAVQLELAKVAPLVVVEVREVPP
jgi:hypothetical protein